MLGLIVDGWMGCSKMSLLRRVFLALGLALVVCFQVAPMYIALTTSLKPRSDLSSQWIFPTQELYLKNFEVAVVDGNILRAIGSSAIVTISSTVLVCVLGALAAYPLARRETLTNKIIYSSIIGLIMVPPLAILVPLYTLMTQIHAVNTYWGVVLVMVTTQLPLAVFLYTSFLRGLPISVEESAIIDGASNLNVLFRIVVPMLKPVTATVVILTSVNVWNEYALSVYMLRSPEVRTVAPTISTFFSSSGVDLGPAAAASLISVMPVLIAYLVLQKWFIRGMVAGAVK